MTCDPCPFVGCPTCPLHQPRRKASAMTMLRDANNPPTAVVVDGKITAENLDPRCCLDTKTDPINPAHYQGFSNGAQVIDIVENLPYNRGAAIKYLARAGRKDPAKHIEDLKKSAWYVAREIERIEGGGHATE